LTSKNFKTAGLGEVLWDLFPEGEKFGGAPANYSCHCHSLGAETYVVSCIGADERGIKARQFLDTHGVDTACLAQSADHETGIVNVTLDEKGKPDYEIKEGVAWDNISMTAKMEFLAPQLDAVCFGSLCQRSRTSRAAIEKFLAGTKPEALRVFDINIRQTFFNDEVLSASLESANLLKLNDKELPVVAKLIGAGGSDEELLKTIIEKFDLKLAVLTCGPKGALMLTREDSSFVASPETNAVDTVGAGDAFAAAAVMGFLKGRPLEEINKHANEVAAFVCTQHGAVPVLPEALIK
jgi:fructokinase